MSEIRTAVDATIATYRSDPAAGPSTGVPAVARLVEGLRVTVDAYRAEGVAFTTDMPSAVGGTATAPPPGWFLRASLASCLATMVGLRAAYLGVALRTLSVTVRSRSDGRGLVGADDAVAAGPTDVDIEVRIGADGADEEVLRGIVDWADAHSYVSDALRRPIPVSLSVHVDDGRG